MPGQIALIDNSNVEVKALASNGALVSSANPLAVGGFTFDNNGIIQTNPTVTAGAYTTLWVVGGIQTLASAARAAGQKVILDSITVADKAAQAAQLSFYFFNAALTGTYNDGAVVSINAADVPKMIGTAAIAAASYVNFGTATKIATLAGIGIQLNSDSLNNIYVVATTTSTPTFTTKCLFFNYGIRQA